jgi:hypothetical protein
MSIMGRKTTNQIRVPPGIRASIYPIAIAKAICRELP